MGVTRECASHDCGMAMRTHCDEQVEQANATGRTPVLFIHGLWLLPSSWDRWADRVRGGRLHGAHAGLARRSRRRSTRPTRIPRCSPTRPSARSPTTSRRSSASWTRSRPSIGHSFGGLLTQILAGRGLSAASVAIDPAPFRGVLPLPISALQVGVAGARQPGQPQPRRPAHLRAVPLRLRQRRQRGRGQGALRDVRRAGVRARRSSRPPRPTSTRGPRRRSTPRTPTAARC